MATLKHIASKNSDYTAIEVYLTYQHDAFTGKQLAEQAHHANNEKQEVPSGGELPAVHIAFVCGFWQGVSGWAHPVFCFALFYLAVPLFWHYPQTALDIREAPRYHLEGRLPHRGNALQFFLFGVC